MPVVNPPSSAGKIPAQSRSVSFPQPASVRPNSGNRPIGNTGNPYYAGAPPARQTPVAPANVQQYDKSGFQKPGTGSFAERYKAMPGKNIPAPQTDPTGFRPFQDQSRPVAPRIRPTTPPANSIQPRTPNSVINRGIPQGLKNTAGGLVPSAAVAAKDFIDKEFDRRFPNLAPLRQAADLANPITQSKSIAEHPYNPLNPFGRLWDWAPWNDRKNPKGLNTPRSAPEPLWPPGTNPNPGNYKLPGTDEPGKGYKARVYSTNNFNFVAWDRLVSFQFQMIGPPFIANMSGTFWRSIPGGFQLDNFFINADPATFSLLGENNAPVAGLEPEPGTGRPWPSPQAGMDPIEIFPPLPSPQYEPIGNPSYPRNPQPDTHPSQTPKPTAPNTAPKPAPLPQPNIPQPQPFPQTQPAPNPQPDTQPFPDGIPRPDPKTGTPPNPAPKPSRVPNRLPAGHWTQDGIQDPFKQPSPQFQNTPWKEPEIIRLNSPLIGKPAPQVQPDPTPKDLQEQIKRVGEGVEESTRRGCQYKEDDLAIANVTRFTGVEPLTNTPQFAVVPMPVHEKLKDYIEIQSEAIAKIQGQADGLRGRIRSVLDRLQIIRIMNLIGAAASIHNAAMLSTNLAQSFGDLLSMVSTKVNQWAGVLGPNESIDINQVLGEQFEEFMKGMVGADTWNGTKDTWKRTNRIISSVTAVIYNIRNIADSAKSLAEMTANNVGKIGNALKRWGVVGENSYGYMGTNIKAGTGFQAKMDRVVAGIETADDTVSSFSSAASEVVNIDEEVRAAGENLQRLFGSSTSNEDKPNPENVPIKASATAAKAASQGTNLNPSDMEPNQNATT